MSHSKRHSRKVALQPRNPDYRGQTRSGTVRSAQVWVHPKNYWFTLWLDVDRFLPWDFRTLANWQTLCSSSLYVTVSSSPGSFPSLVRREKTDCSMGVVFQSEVRRSERRESQPFYVTFIEAKSVWEKNAEICAGGPQVIRFMRRPRWNLTARRNWPPELDNWILLL